MTNQLTFRLNEPIEQLIPAMINFNEEELLTAATELANFYSSLVYAEDDVARAKEDRAKLNNLLKAINAERIRISKVYNEPYNAFKAKVDRVCDTLQKPIDLIGNQLEEYEQKRKELKRGEIEDYYQSVIPEEFAGLLPLDKIFNDKWLNSGSNIKSIKADIDKKIADVRSDLSAIEALHSEDELGLIAYYFRTLDLGLTLVEGEKLKAEKKRIQEVAAKRAAEKQAENQSVQPKPADTPAAPQQIEKHYTVTLEFNLTKPQSQLLLEFLNTNGLAYIRIK